MEEKKLYAASFYPKNLRSSVMTARNFFKGHNELLLYEHGKSVLGLALKNKIIDKNILNGSVHADGRIKNFNHILTQIILYHTLEVRHINFTDKILPLVIRNSTQLYTELEKFSMITDVIRSGRDISELIDIINHDTPPLALLAVLVDVAQTHVDESKTFKFIKKNHYPMFRFYSSKEEAEIVTKNTARFGEVFLAQVAELFGYPSIAGQIFMQSYSINHPYIFEVIMNHNNNEETIRRAKTTISFIRLLKRTIKNSLSSMNFEFEIQLREKKNLGKQMKKLAFRLRDKYPEIIANGAPDSEKQIAEQKKVISKLSLFDFFNDFIALRIILDKVDGKSISELDKKTEKYITTVVKDFVCQVLRTVNPFTFDKQHIDKKFFNTKKGYKSWHIDIDPRDEKLLKYEVQIRTRDWHDIAEFGKVAHYLYVNMFNNSEPMEKISYAYRDFLRSETNYNKSQTGKN